MTHLKSSLALPWRFLAVSLFLLLHAVTVLAAPTVTVPADGGTYQIAPTMATGSTGAPQGDSATAVWVLLYRYANGNTPEGYFSTEGIWTPRAQYSGAKNLLPARIQTGGTWSYTLPSAAQGLVPSQYVIAVKARYSQHPGASSPYSLFTLIAPDHTSPAITFTRPTNGAALQNLNPISGTVIDNGSGVQSVQVEIMRASDRLWWTGSAWGARTQLNALLRANGTWTLNSGLPTGANLQDGVYSLNALATDKAGNRSKASVTVRVDQSAPTVSISTPSSTQQVPTIKPISGTAADSGSGVQSVQVSIQRESDDAFWNGSAWVSASTLLSTQLAVDGTWSRPAGYPLGSDLQSGFYSIGAIVTDKAGNQGQSSVRVQVNTSLPTIHITSPSDGAVFTTPDLGTISGTALDNPGGEGIAQVRLTLQRQSDGLFWTGTEWGEDRQLATTLQMNGQWSKNSGLPSGDDLLRGRYVLTATAIDKAGNAATKSITVTVAVPGVNFGPPQRFAEQLAAVALAAGDFNTDGKLDVVTADSTNRTVSILQGDGDGNFVFRKGFATGGYPVAVVVADYNGDGNLDVATANQYSSDVLILLGDGNGNLGSPTKISFGAYVAPVTAADFNNDGKLDLLVATAASSNNLSVLLGNGTGGFDTKVVIESETQLGAPTVADFNADGKLDLAVADGGNTVSILLGDGTGHFGIVSHFTFASPLLTAADFNDDGKPDLAAASADTLNASTLLGDGSGGFGSPRSFVVAPQYLNPGIRGLIVADFDGDGKLDLAIANYRRLSPADESGSLNSFVSILPGDGTGNLGTPRDFLVREVSSYDYFGPLVTGDFNNDGKLDLALTDDGSVSVLLNASG